MTQDRYYYDDDNDGDDDDDDDDDSFKVQKRSLKGQCQTPLRVWCVEHPSKVTTWCMQFLNSYRSQGHLTWG